MGSRTLRFGKNVGWNLIGQGGLLALGFLLVPILIRDLGAEGYALYGVLGLLAGYLSLLNFGAPSATQRIVASRVARGETDRLWPLLYFSALVHTLGVLLAAAAVFVFRENLAQGLFIVTPDVRLSGAWVIACGAASAVFFSWTYLALAVLQGFQDFATANLLTLLQNGSTLVGAVVLLRLGLGLREIAVFFVAVQLAIALLGLAAALRLMPPPSSDFPRPSVPDARAFAGYAFSVFLAQAAWSATFQWDKAIIGYFFPLTQLTYYLVPSFLLRRLGILANAVMTTAFPLMSGLSGLGDQTALRTSYRQCSQLALWLAIPGFALLFVLAPQFLTLWLGAEFAGHAARPLRLLLTAYFLHQLGTMPQTAAYGLGRPSSALAWQSLQAAICLGCWFVLIPRMGIDGAALGLLAAQALTAPAYALLASRSLFAMGPREYLGGILLRPLAASSVFILFLWPLRGSAGSWSGLLVLAAASTFMYGAAGFALLSDEDRLTFQKAWSALRRA